MGWISATSYNQPDGDYWENPQQAFDEGDVEGPTSFANYLYTYQKGKSLELILPAVKSCDKIKIYSSQIYDYAGEPYEDSVCAKIEVWNNDASIYETIFDGELAALEWVEIEIPGAPKNITKARITYNSSNQGDSMYIYEMMFNEAEGIAVRRQRMEKT